MNQDQISRPEKVAIAVKLFYITLGIGVLRSIMEASIHAQMASPAFVMFVAFFVLGIMWLFIYMIGKGRNWARITLLVLFIVGIPFSVLTLLQSLAANPISGLLGIGQTVIQIIALVFLFQKPSSDWFREMKATVISCPQCSELNTTRRIICKACGADLKTTSNAVIRSKDKQQPICKVCDQGELQGKKKYRMGIPVVIIGYIFLIPSILILLNSFFEGDSKFKSLEKDVRKDLTQVLIPNTIIQKVIDFEEITDEDKAGLLLNQIQALDEAIILLSAYTIGFGAGKVVIEGFAILGILLGFFLTMKKKVLQCTNCKAVVNIS